MKISLRISKIIQGTIAWLFIVSSAHAQESMTVGEIIAKGGKKLTKEQVTAKFAVAVTVEGVLAVNPNRKAVNTYKPDGTFSGRTSDLNGNSAYGLTGKWRINDVGQTCSSEVTNSNGRDVTPRSPCSFYFVLGDTHYNATSDAPDSVAYRRQVR